VDPYRVLFVHPSAPQPVIRAAYHALARLHHPDRTDDPEAERLMAQLNLAYAMVHTPEARSALAREQNRGGHGQPADTPPAQSGRRPAGLQETIRIRRKQATSGPAGTAATAARDGDGDGISPVVMDYGRYEGWRLEEIAHTDRGYLEWLRRSPAGRRFRTEISRLLAAPAT